MGVNKGTASYLEGHLTSGCPHVPVHWYGRSISRLRAWLVLMALVSLTPSWARRVRGEAISSLLRQARESLQLRSKLLLSFVSLTAGLTCATLLVVRHNAEAQAQQQLEQGARDATLALQVSQRQQELALVRKADLLASLAFMRNGDPTAIEDAGNDPWQSEDCNLFVLADKNARIVAVHSTGPAFPDAAAQKMLWRSLGRKETAGWWSSGKNLYQIVVQPFYEDVWE